MTLIMRPRSSINSNFELNCFTDISMPGSQELSQWLKNILSRVKGVQLPRTSP